MVDYVKNFALGFMLKETGCAGYVACDVGRLFFFLFCNFLQNLCLENIQSDFSGTRKVGNIRRLLTLLQHLESTTDSSFFFFYFLVSTTHTSTVKVQNLGTVKSSFTFPKSSYAD